MRRASLLTVILTCLALSNIISGDTWQTATADLIENNACIGRELRISKAGFT